MAFWLHNFGKSSKKWKFLETILEVLMEICIAQWKGTIRQTQRHEDATELSRTVSPKPNVDTPLGQILNVNQVSVSGIDCEVGVKA